MLKLKHLKFFAVLLMALNTFNLKAGYFEASIMLCRANSNGDKKTQLNALNAVKNDYIYCIKIISQYLYKEITENRTSDETDAKLRMILMKSLELKNIISQKQHIKPASKNRHKIIRDVAEELEKFARKCLNPRDRQKFYNLINADANYTGNERTQEEFFKNFNQILGFDYIYLKALKPLDDLINQMSN